MIQTIYHPYISFIIVLAWIIERIFDDIKLLKIPCSLYNNRCVCVLTFFLFFDIAKKNPSEKFFHSRDCFVCLNVLAGVFTLKTLGPLALSKVKNMNTPYVCVCNAYTHTYICTFLYPNYTRFLIYYSNLRWSYCSLIYRYIFFSYFA